MTNPPSLPAGEIRRSILPLKLIFWGGLISLIDLHVLPSWKGFVWTLDVFPDLLGMALVAAGALGLRRIPAGSGYRAATMFIFFMAVFSGLWSLSEPLAYNSRFHIALEIPRVPFGLGDLLAIVLLCRAGRQLCRQAEMASAERAWKLTTALFVLIYIVPLGVFYLMGAAQLITGDPYFMKFMPIALLERGVWLVRLDLPPGSTILPARAVPLLYAIFALPLLSMYGAIARMRGQARRAEAAAPNGKGAEDAEEADLERIAAEEADPDPAKAPNAAEANS